jgi:hypothetical protein
MLACGTSRTRSSTRSQVWSSAKGRHSGHADKARYTDALDRRVCCIISGTVLPCGAHFWLTKVRYISARYTSGMTVSTPIWMIVGAGQLVAHIW